MVGGEITMIMKKLSSVKEKRNWARNILPLSDELKFNALIAPSAEKLINMHYLIASQLNIVLN